MHENPTLKLILWAMFVDLLAYTMYAFVGVIPQTLRAHPNC